MGRERGRHRSRCGHPRRAATQEGFCGRIAHGEIQGFAAEGDRPGLHQPRPFAAGRARAGGARAEYSDRRGYRVVRMERSRPRRGKGACGDRDQWQEPRYRADRAPVAFGGGGLRGGRQYRSAGAQCIDQAGRKTAGRLGARALQLPARNHLVARARCGGDAEPERRPFRPLCRSRGVRRSQGARLHGQGRAGPQPLRFGLDGARLAGAHAGDLRSRCAGHAGRFRHSRWPADARQGAHSRRRRPAAVRRAQRVERARRLCARLPGGRAARRAGRGLTRLPRAAASHAARRAARRGRVAGRFEGHQCRRHAGGTEGRRAQDRADPRRRGQGAELRAARARDPGPREARAADRARCAAHPHGDRGRGRADRILRVARGGGRARRPGRQDGRRRAAVAGLRELRHVPRLQAPRRGVCRRGEGAESLMASLATLPIFGQSNRTAGAPAPEYDRSLAWAALLLVALGLVMVYSASIATAEASRYAAHNPAYFLFRHGVFLALALACATAVFLTPLRYWQKSAPWLFAACFVLLALVLIPGVGREVNGARRWLNLGVATVQPSELMKLAVVLYAADYTVRKHAVLKSFRRGLLPMLGVMLAVAWLLLREPDFGAFVVVAVTAFGVLFLGGMNGRHFTALVGMLRLGFAALVLSSPYRMQRTFGLMDPWSDAFGKGHLLSHALIAFGRGEWLGVGLGASVEKLHYLPEAHTDFLLAVIAEELGLAGVVLVIGLFVWVLLRAFAIGRQAAMRERHFHALVAQGIGIWIGFQALINMGVNMGLLPTKGLTLPLMSFGGSGLIVNCVAIAVLIRIDWENRQLARGLSA